MHIVFLSQRIPYPPNKGEKLRTYHQIEHLHSLGHRITVLAPCASVEEQNNANALSQHLNIEVHTANLPNKLSRLAKALLTGSSFSEANFYSSKLVKLLQQHINDCDALIVTASSLAPYVTRVSNTNNALVLMDFMDVDSDKWQQYALASSWPKKWVYSRESAKIKQLEQHTVKHFEHSFLIAQAEVDLFTKHVCASNKLSVLGNGIDHRVFAPGADKSHNANEPVFFFAGVMDYKPNIDAVHWFVEHCWPNIIAVHPKASFVIGGMNPVKSISALAQQPNITVTGFVDNIIPYFQQATVFIAPFQIARGVQNKVLQAMSCALAVVTTPMGAEGILHTHGENMMVATDASSFSQHCIALASNATQCQQLGDAAREVILNNYAWPSVLAPLVKVLQANHKGE